MLNLLSRAFRCSRRTAIVACALLVLIPPSVAYAATWFNYAQGTNGVGGTFATTGFAPRDGNRVWHQAGYSWWVWYQHTDNSLGCIKFNDSNPTACYNPDGYAKSKCSNSDDNSGVTWTCQTINQSGSPIGTPATGLSTSSERSAPRDSTSSFHLKALSGPRTPADDLQGT